MDEARKKYLLGYLFFSALGALLLVMIMKAPAGKPAMSLLLKIIVWLVAIGPGMLGALIGDMLRRWLMPDFVFGGGFFDLLKEKLFWGIGPQLIGMVIGLALGSGLVIKLAGY